MKGLYKFLCFASVECLLACCKPADGTLEWALRLAEENREQLEAVLNHYKEDSLKLEAARFLIRNMPYHHSKCEYFLSPDGKKFRSEVLYAKSEEEGKRYRDSLMRKGFGMEQRQVPDITAIDSSFLIRNIESAFAVWKKPWAKEVPFEDFCRYILPYRAQTEALSALREEIVERFIPLLDSAQVATPMEACILLNEKLSHLIRYKKTGFPFYATVDETYRFGVGLCEGLCNVGTFIMRAVGIPVAVDMTVWVKMDLGHSWCAVLDNGQFYSFGPGEQQPGEHARRFSVTRHCRPAKVYRRHFAPVTYGKRMTDDDGYKAFFKSPLLSDVTNEYLDSPTCIKVAVDKEKTMRSRASEQVYLCVYNFYQWSPLAMGSYTDGTCVFRDVVGDNIFIVADCPDGDNLRYITPPFYVNRQGDIHPLIPQKQKLQAYTLPKRKGKEHIEHTLYYWDVEDTRFIPLASKEENDTSLIYDRIPENALLWFTIPERIVNQRVFFIENDSIKRY